VRAIFAWITEYGSMQLTLAEIERRVGGSKVGRARQAGSGAGGPFALNSLWGMLRF